MKVRLLFLGSIALGAVTVLAQQRPPSGAAAAHDWPWMNKSLSPDERADLVIKELTFDEKIQLVHGIGWGPLGHNLPVPADNNGGAGEVEGIARLGIPSLQEADSAVGVRMAAYEGRYATLLPSVLGSAASWDADAAHLYGDVIGRELRAEGFNQSIGGGVNLARDPRNGRLFEYAGEDPLLAGVTVGHVIMGVQQNHILGDIKHFAVNDQETGRTIVNVEIGKKAMHESDLLAFEIGIAIGHPASVMCSYNKLNGDWACENDYLLNHVLKGSWKYPGFVVSDWTATHSTAKAANAGLDLEMPGSDLFGSKLAAAVKSGEVTQERLDNMVHRVLRSMFANGAMDYPSLPRSVVDPFRGEADAEHIADESLVLLRNEHNVLPLDAAGLHSIAVIGGHADKGVMSGGGSAQVDAPGGNAINPGEPTAWGKPVYFPSAPLKYIRQHADGADVQFASGSDVAEAAALAKKSDVAIVFADQYEQEGADSADLTLPNGQDALIAAVAAANPRTVVVLITGNPLTMPWVDNVAGIVEAWYPGIGGGQAIADVLFGRVNPSGKLPITFPRSIEDLPHRAVFGMGTEGGQPAEGKEKQVKSFPAELTEGVRFGYKWYDSEKKEPLFPFGFGMSYTQFAYSGLQVNASDRTATFTLQNTGSRAGVEIAQVYVQLPSASGEHFRRLAGWQRVPLAAGEKKQVTVAMAPLTLATFNETKDGWEWLPGQYEVSVGGSSRSLRMHEAADLSH